jgi:hypothetical protein
MASVNIVCAQFEIEDDPSGLARASAFLLAQQYANANVLIASDVYARESGTAFLVLITGEGESIGPGTNTVFQVIEVEIEDDAGGLDLLQSQILAAVYAGLTHILSFHVTVRDSGSAFAVVIMSN